MHEGFFRTLIFQLTFEQKVIWAKDRNEDARHKITSSRVLLMTKEIDLAVDSDVNIYMK